MRKRRPAIMLFFQINSSTISFNVLTSPTFPRENNVRHSRKLYSSPVIHTGIPFFTCPITRAFFLREELCSTSDRSDSAFCNDKFRLHGKLSDNTGHCIEIFTEICGFLPSHILRRKKSACINTTVLPEDFLLCCLHRSLYRFLRPFSSNTVFTIPLSLHETTSERFLRSLSPSSCALPEGRTI